MAITYTWELLSLKRKNVNDLQNTVAEVEWEKTGTNEDGLVGNVSGETQFDADIIDPDNFTAFENLTEEMVLGWVQEKISGEYENMVNQAIEKKIQDKIAPETLVSSSNFPWLI